MSNHYNDSMYASEEKSCQYKVFDLYILIRDYDD